MPLTVTSRWLGHVLQNARARCYERAWFGRDEELRNVTFRQPCSIRLYDACHIRRFADNGQLTRRNQRGKPRLSRLKWRAVGVHVFIAECADDALWHNRLDEEVVVQ